MLKINEIIQATKGKLIRGGLSSSVKNISIDTRSINKGDAFLAIKGNNFDGHDFIGQAIKKGACCIIVGSRGNSPEFQKPDMKGVSVIEVKDTLKALGDTALFLRRKYAFPVIAVTGSSGKTTVKEMIAWILSKQFKVLKTEGTRNNQVGLPLTLLRANALHQIAVLELGTNHPGEIESLSKICEPNVGVITNIGPGHLEYFLSLSGVLKEKNALIKQLKKPAISLLNADDSRLRKKISASGNTAAIFSFGIKEKSDFSAKDIKCDFGKLEFSLNFPDAEGAVGGGSKKRRAGKNCRFILRGLGYNNIYNALAAIAVARIFGMGYEDISRRLVGFMFPKSRLNLISVNNVNFIDDTYNSNPLSLEQALGALENSGTKGRKIFIMGDMLELGTFKESFHVQAGRRLLRTCDTFIAVGKLSKLTADAAQSCGFNAGSIFTCESSLEARDILFNKILPVKDDVVLIKGSRGMKMEEILKKV